MLDECCDLMVTLKLLYLEFRKLYGQLKVVKCYFGFLKSLWFYTLVYQALYKDYGTVRKYGSW